MAKSTIFSRVALGVGVKEFARELAMHEETVIAFAYRLKAQLVLLELARQREPLTTKALKVKFAQFLSLGNYAIV